MKNEIVEYRKSIKEKIDADAPETDWCELSETLMTRIKFYQHERLIHLIVTMTFALMTVMSFGMIMLNTMFVLLALLFLALVIPYIFHYYLLENSVQELYTFYYTVYERSKREKATADSTAE